MLSWGLGFGTLIAVMAPAYVAAAGAISGGLAALAAQAQPLADSFQFLTGPAERLDTVGGYLSYKVFPDVALLLALYAAMQGAQIIRGAETRGLFDLWLAAGRTRNAIVRDQMAGFLSSLAVAVGCILVGTVVGGGLSGVQLVLPALGQCVAVGLVALFGFGLGLLLAQFCRTARSAGAMACGFLAASFFVANMSDHLGPVTFLRYLSPFYLYLQCRTLVAGNGFSVGAMAVMLVAAVALAGTAWFLLLRRDTGGVSLARIHRTRTVDYSFRPSTVWRRSLWLSWISEQPMALASWFGGIMVFTTIEAAMVPSAMRVLDTGGGGLKRVLASNGVAFTSDQYLSFFLSFTALLAAAFTLTQVARWASDASQHRTDVVLTQPVSMGGLLVGRAFSLLAMSMVIGAATIAGVYLGAMIGRYGVLPVGLVRGLVDTVVLCLAIGGVGTVAVTALRSAAATGVTGAVVLASLILTTVSGLLSWPRWTARPSIFDAFGSPYLSTPGAASLAYLGALGIGGVLVGYVAMRRGARIAT